MTVETDMTDIGTGTYTVIAQTAAEMMGVPIEKVRGRMGDSSFPVSCGSGGAVGRELLHLRRVRGVHETGVRVREYPIKLDKLIAAMPQVT